METIILLHGALGNSADLLPLETSLRKRGLNTEVYNFPGHGNEPFSKDFNVATFANCLWEKLEKIREDPIYIFGYSMGGYVALHMLGFAPFVGTIFTLGTQLTWSPELAAAELLKLDPEKMENKVPAFAKKLSQAHGDKWKEVVRKTARLIDDLGKNNYLGDDALSQIQNKVFLGLGDKDTMADAADTFRVSNVVKNGRMYMLPDTKHQIETVNTGLLADIICSEIKQQS